MMSNLKKYEKLIHEFKSISILENKQKQTFMDVCGYPHFENVISNILAFLFCDTEEHGMKNLWINALLRCIGITHGTTNVTVEREVVTNNGKRIDLAITSDDYAFCIENKIYSGVYNDLQEYASTVEKIASENELSQINIILSLKNESNVAQTNGYKNVMYSELIENVRSLMGYYIEEADNTWVLYMKDFMQTICSLEGRADMNKELGKFMIDHHRELCSLGNEIEKFRKEIRTKTQELREILNLNLVLEGIPYRTFCYNTKHPNIPYSSVCIDITRPDSRILTVETFYDYEGWHVTLFDRNRKENGKNEIVDWLKENNIEYVINQYEPYKVEIAKCDIEEDLNTVSAKINEAVETAKKMLA